MPLDCGFACFGESFLSGKKNLKRTVIFLAVTAEEQGLWGSL